MKSEKCTAVPLTARDMGQELLAETVTRKDAGASPMEGFTACLSKKLPIHVSDGINIVSYEQSKGCRLLRKVNGTAVR